MEKKFNNIEKRLSSGGPTTPPLDMKQFIKLAEADTNEVRSKNHGRVLYDLWETDKRIEKI